MSGRTPARTDYIYHVTSADGFVHPRPAHRTLKSAKATAGTGLTRPVCKKVGPHRWTVTSSLLAECSSTITRVPLVN